jgi:hypothetical protein
LLAIGAGGFRRLEGAEVGWGGPGPRLCVGEEGWVGTGVALAEVASWHGRRRVVPRHLEEINKEVRWVKRW